MKITDDQFKQARQIADNMTGYHSRVDGKIITWEEAVRWACYLAGDSQAVFEDATKAGPATLIRLFALDQSNNLGYYSKCLEVVTARQLAEITPGMIIIVQDENREILDILNLPQGEETERTQPHIVREDDPIIFLDKQGEIISTENLPEHFVYIVSDREEYEREYGIAPEEPKKPSIEFTTNELSFIVHLLRRRLKELQAPDAIGLGEIVEERIKNLLHKIMVSV